MKIRPISKYRQTLFEVYNSIQEICFLLEDVNIIPSANQKDIQFLYKFADNINSTITRLSSNENISHISQRDTISSFNYNLNFFIEKFNVFAEKLFEDVRNEFHFILDSPKITEMIGNLNIDNFTSLTTVEQWGNVYESILEPTESKIDEIGQKKLDLCEKIISKGLAASKIKNEFSVLFNIHQEISLEENNPNQSSINEQLYQTNQNLLKQIENLQQENMKKDQKFRELKAEVKKERNELEEKYENEIEHLRRENDMLSKKYEALLVATDEIEKDLREEKQRSWIFVQQLRDLQDSIADTVPISRFEKSQEKYIKFLEMLQKYTT
ncbi:hypothetical protein TRFO_26828 [Tritrichomonas foetus]|uniref:Uncharacterized protein n=1 Tax=Tritrichomonas foetus TaxID=1144522 RepID=A0A1J4K205_9EUKA|nr:hypothetical protein TRFO_26828 [Tritrichomonas foetus]|eukprot:OHT05473.1 hypothetical protein TRFO_26828 [Tritrichomonas foetus]